MQLNTTEAAQVTAWAADSLEISPYAKTIMAWAYNTPWEHEVEPTPMISYSAKPQLPVNNRIESERSNLQPAIPNPAMQTARIPVYINKADAALQPMLVIRNIMGMVVAQYPLTAGSQQITVDVRNFNNGIYTYSLMLNGKQGATFKLSVLH
jgi:nitrate reductase beta subunit